MSETVHRVSLDHSSSHRFASLTSGVWNHIVGFVRQDAHLLNVAHAEVGVQLGIGQLLLTVLAPDGVLGHLIDLVRDHDGLYTPSVVHERGLGKRRGRARSVARARLPSSMVNPERFPRCDKEKSLTFFSIFFSLSLSSNDENGIRLTRRLWASLQAYFLYS